MSFTEIATVDLRRWTHSEGTERIEFAAEVADLCHRVGFFVLTEHGVDPAATENAFEVMRSFFDLPVAVKQQIDKRDSRHFRGWEAVGSEYTNNLPDMREQLDLWTEGAARPVDVEPAYLRMLGPNQWLADSVLPGHREVLESWIAELNSLGETLLEVLSVGLGLDQDHLATVFGPDPLSLTKFIHYPPTPPNTAGVNGHHDTGFLTVLAAGDTPGLEVQNPEGAWIPVPVVPGAFVINLGEMLQAISGNYFVATPHRVIAATERYSAGYFFGPSIDTPITPLPLAPRFAERVAASPRHATAGFMAASDEVADGVTPMSSSNTAGVYGEQVWNYLTRSYPQIAAQHYNDL